MYKLMISVLMVLALVGCGKDPQTSSGSGTVVIGEPASAFEGYYTFPNAAYARIDENAYGLFDINTIRIVLNNADGSQGLIPLASTTAMPNVNDVLYYTASLTYATLTHNIKQDSNNAILNGAFLTEVFIYKSSGLLNVRAMISSVNGTVLFDHTMVQL